MTFQEAMEAVKKGKTVTRLAWKVGRRYGAKIVPRTKNKPWLWERTSIPFVFHHTKLGEDDLLEENTSATDWVVCGRPS